MILQRRAIALLVSVLLLLGIASILRVAFLHWMFVPRFPPIARFPNGIVIHHTASPPFLHGRVVDAAVLNAMHMDKGFGAVRGRDGTVYHIAYHFVIMPDGTVQRGRPEYLPGAHTLGHPEMLGIVLVGNFHGPSNRGFAGPLTPPAAQLSAAERLTRELMAKYALPVTQVYLHRDLRPTACPGDHFPRKAFYAGIPR